MSTNQEFVSEAYKKLKKCGELLPDTYKVEHICERSINHKGNHICACEEQWSKLKTKKEKK